MNRANKLVSAFAAVIVFATFLLPGGRALGETLQVNGIEMHYEIIGQGKPLILLHGWSQSGETWSGIADDFAKHFQVIIPDLRGHGATNNPSGEYFTRKQLALDVYALLDHLEIETTKAMGISMGGITLLHMATQQPERIDAMVLIGAASYGSTGGRKISRGIDLDNIPEDQMRQFRKIHKHGDQQIIAMLKQSKTGADDYESTAFTPPYLSTIRANTLIVHGERDRRVPISIALEMYEAIPNSFLWIVPNGGHVPIREFYEENFIKVTEAFLLGQMTPQRNKNID
jgi:pimeloyl-ACP methyl ester carboxylesterase